MNILLADDERLTRLGLKSMIEELYPGLHTFQEVSDGEMLLEFLEQNKPDLIFLDIHMPRITGLQAFSQFKDRQIPVIMLTGYAEFEYARDSLKMGALDYLLKPAGLNEIKTAMEKAILYCSKQSELRRRDYELEFEKILDLYTTIGFFQKPKYVLSPYTCILFYFDRYRPEAFKEDLDRLHEILYHICGSQTLSAITFMPTGEVCFLASGSIPLFCFQNGLTDFHKTQDLKATGFYLQSDSLPDLFSRLEAVQKEESLRFCIGLGSVISEEDRQRASSLLPFSSLLEKILMAHRAGDLAALQKYLPDLEKIVSEVSVLKACDHSLNQILSLETGSTVSIHRASQLMDCLRNMSSQLHSPDLIDRINLYIEEHYMEQIGINTIADKISISPNYLSKIYKMKTGENFTDHLTNTRIQKAEELMKSGRTATVRETAEQVGYFSTRYFTKVFLKNTGILPSEYLKNHVLNHTPASHDHPRRNL